MSNIDPNIGKIINNRISNVPKEQNKQQTVQNTSAEITESSSLDLQPSAISGRAIVNFDLKSLKEEKIDVEEVKKKMLERFPEIDLEVTDKNAKLINILLNSKKGEEYRYSQWDIECAIGCANDDNIPIAEKLYSDEEFINSLSITKNIPLLLYYTNKENTPFVETLYENKKLDILGLNNKCCYFGGFLPKINSTNRQLLTRLFLNEDFPQENKMNTAQAITSSINNKDTNDAKMSIAKIVCFDKDFPKEFADRVIYSTNEKNVDLAKDLCKDKDFPKEHIAKILDKTKDYLMSLAKTLCKENDFPKEVIPKILDKLSYSSYEEIKYAEEVCLKNDIPKEELPNWLIYIKSEEIYKIYQDFKEDTNYSKRDIEKILGTAKYNPELIKNMYKNRGFEHKEIMDILPYINESNSNLTNIMCLDENITSKNIVEILDSIACTAFFGEEKINYVQLAETLCSDKSLNCQANQIPNIIRAHEILTTKNIEEMTLHEKIKAFTASKDMSNETKDFYNRMFNVDINSLFKELKTSLNNKKNILEVNPEEQIKFFKEFVANNNPTSDNVLKTYDFAQYKEQGLPLKHKREDFSIKVDKLLNELSEKEQTILMNHFGISKGDGGHNDIVDFDGLMTNKPLTDEESVDLSDKAKENAEKIREAIENFTTKNEVMIDDPEIKKVLDGLVKGLPEFTSIVGKEQHGTHNYSVDIHTLKVLQNAMNNPLYEELSNVDKTVLKISILLHDLAKKGGIIDEGHAHLSSDFAGSILQKMKLPKKVKDRIIDIVDNHHWFEEYNTQYSPNGDNSEIAKNVVVRCRRPGDFKIYQIFAKADFQSVNPTFHLGEKSGGAKTEDEFDDYFNEAMIPIQTEADKMRAKSNIIYDTRFNPKGNLFPSKQTQIDGKNVEVKILDLNQLQNDDSLVPYGFAKGTTKENSRFLVHMTEPIESELESVMIATENPLIHSTWSTSLIQPNSNATFKDLNFGFIFTTEQANISSASNKNIGTGGEKGLELFKHYLLENNDIDRTFVRDKFLEILKEKGIELNDEEYAKLAEQLVEHSHINALKEDISIGEKRLPKNIFIESLEEARDKLFLSPEEHNEIVPITPHVAGLVAKVNSFEEIEEQAPQFIKFAHKYNLPIIIMRPIDEEDK